MTINIFQSTQPKRAATHGQNRITTIETAFQSTQPKRAATIVDIVGKSADRISIHAAQEGCDVMTTYIDPAVVISIHAAQEGCDS